MAGSISMSAPDLTAGVQLDTLQENKPLLGRVDNEAVMLVRSQGEVFAVSTSCTHYGGPLESGLVEGQRVHCPWHHACFELRSGIAAGPALSPLQCYEVQTLGSLVRVWRKREPSIVAPPLAPSSVVIVGAGAAGTACAENLRRLGYEGSITLVGDEMAGPVDRPMLSKDYLAGATSQANVLLGDLEHYRARGIELVLGDAARSVDPAGHEVQLESGRRCGYGALLLATGSSPRRLDIAGASAPHVLSLRTLADARAISERARAGARVVIIGSSFIGLEAAAALRTRDLHVDVVSSDPLPLGRVLGDTLGRYLRRLHERQGVRFHLGRRPTRIGAAHVQLDDGSSVPADFVVLGIGVSPRSKLAQATARLDPAGGVIVDEQLRTAHSDVYAAGDIASYPDARSTERVRIEHWAMAVRQGQAVARSMLGQGTAFQDVPFFWSAHYDVTLGYVGHAAHWDRLIERGDPEEGLYMCGYERDGQVRAVVSLGDDLASLEAEVALQAGDQARLGVILRG